MTKRTTLLFVLTLTLLLAFSATTWASSNTVENVKQGNSELNFKAAQYQTIDETGPAAGRNSASLSLGSYSQDGGSPGYIIGRTWRDAQSLCNPGRMVEWRAPHPQIHFAQTYQVCVGDPDACARYYHYQMYDPTTGTFPYGTGGVALQTNPLAGKQGTYVQLAVDETGAGIVTGHTWVQADIASLTYADTYWDIGAGTFVSNRVDSTLALSDSSEVIWPRIAYSDRNGTQVTHLLCMEENFDTGFNVMTYWRKLGSGDPGVWTTQTVNEVIGAEYQIAASTSSDEVAIAWVQDISTVEDEDYGSYLYYRLSHNLGVDWDAEQNIIPWAIDQTCWVPWVDLGIAYDTDGYLHIVYNANEYSADSQSAAGRDPSRIMHWTNRVSGPDAGGTTVTVHVADFHGLSMMCGVGGWNTFNVARPVISQCNDKMYCIWQQFGDPDTGDSLDCAAADFYNSWNAYNGNIYLSVSSSLNGSLWDAARNLTPATAIDCDTTENNECDHAVWATMADFGMNTGDYTPTTWSSVNSGALHAFQVRDAIAPGYSDDGWYLDVQYMNDLVPDVAIWDQYDESPGAWSNNPVKWFRLPCVDPVIEPRINVAQTDMLYPTVWVRGGDEYVEDVLVENLGNADLTVDNIYVTVDGGSPAGIVTVTPTNLFILAGSSDNVDVTLNPGGLVAAGSRASIDAEVFFHSDDPNRPLVSFEVHSVVADTVVQVVWDAIATGLGVDLAVANNGNAGNVGVGGNLDFFDTGLECDSAQTVYLYDATPIVMVSPSNYSWGPFWQPARANAAINFQPVGDGLETQAGPGDGFVQYQSGTFVTADSTIAGNKIWVAPDDNVSFVIERWAVYSYDGGSHTAWLGEWIDWDIPSDTGSNNEGGFSANPGGVDYVYQKGLEYHEDDTSACLDSDRRFGGSGLLGYYLASEYEANDAVNNTGLYGGHINLDEDYFADETDSLIPDSVWAWLQKNELSTNNTEESDQQALLSFGQNTISATDTLVFWVVHASVYDGDETTLAGIMDSAMTWYMAKRADVGTFGCCGAYTGGYTGNANCDIEGKRNLADISKLIDRVYLSKAALCCEANGNVNGDVEDKINLADISKLIDHVYLSKAETAACP